MTKSKRKTAKHEHCGSEHSDENFAGACVAALKEFGGRITKTRLAVIQQLAAAHSPLSIGEIFQAISKNKALPSIDQTSVYRIIQRLSDAGLVHQVFPSGGYLPCFHAKCQSALHILTRCSTCEAIEELGVPQETVSPMVWYLKNHVGFEPTGHVFQINGLCKACRK